VKVKVMVMVVEIMVVILRFFWDSSLGKREGSVRMKLRKEEQGKLKNGQLDVMSLRGI
jgi:hypothetical protein